MTEIAPLFKDRQGGYTRVLRLPARPGDGSDMGLLSFTAQFEVVAKPKKAKKEKKQAPAEKTPERGHEPADKKEKAKKADKDSKEADSKKEAGKAESEKKGGFLSTLRKFLKGSD